MNLDRDLMVDPGIERRLKVALAATLAKRPAERKQASRLRWGAIRGRLWPLVGLVAICAAAFAVMCLRGLDEAGRLGVASAAVFFVALIRRMTLWAALNASPDLFALTLWPADPDLVFKRQWNIGIRNWLAELLTLSICVGMVQPYGLGLPAVLGVVMGFLGLRVVSLAIAAATALWPRLMQLGWLGLGLMGVSLYVTRSENAEAHIVRFWNATGDFWTAVLPTGWVLRPIHAVMTGGPWTTCLLLIPALAFSALLPWAAKRLRREHRYRDAVLLQYAAEGLPEWSEEQVRQFHELLISLPKTVPERLRESVVAGDFLRPEPAVVRGPLGRLVWNWLGERERLVVEWGQEGALALEQNVRNAAILAVVGIVAAFLFHRADYPIELIIGVATGAIVLLVLRARGLQRVFRPVQDIALESPWLAFVPVSVSEVAAVLWKVSIVLTPVAVAMLAVIGWVMARLAGADLVEWSVAGGRLGLILPALAHLDLVLRLNRLSNFMWRGSLIQAFVILPSLLVCAAGLVATVAWSSWWCLLVVLGTHLAAFATYLVARWCHRRHHFDLIRKIPSNG